MTVSCSCPVRASEAVLVPGSRIGEDGSSFRDIFYFILNLDPVLFLKICREGSEKNFIDTMTTAGVTMRNAIDQSISWIALETVN